METINYDIEQVSEVLTNLGYDLEVHIYPRGSLLETVVTVTCKDKLFYEARLLSDSDIARNVFLRQQADYILPLWAASKV